MLLQMPPSAPAAGSLAAWLHGGTLNEAAQGA